MGVHQPRLSNPRTASPPMSRVGRSSLQFSESVSLPISARRVQARIADFVGDRTSKAGSQTPTASSSDVDQPLASRGHSPVLRVFHLAVSQTRLRVLLREVTYCYRYYEGKSEKQVPQGTYSLMGSNCDGTCAHSTAPTAPVATPELARCGAWKTELHPSRISRAVVNLYMYILGEYALALTATTSEERGRYASHRRPNRCA